MADAPPAPRPPTSSNPWDAFVPSVADGLQQALAVVGLPLPRDELLEQLDLDGGPDGEIALPVFRFAPSVKRAPPELAAAIAAAVPPNPWVRSVTAKGGYVNVALEPVRLVTVTLDLVLGRGARYGHADPGGNSVCVEHTSANPTGPFHIGRVRNAIIGDTLARVRRAAGQPVTTQYYIDDMGRQAAMITWIWSKPEAQWPAPIRAVAPGAARPDDKPDLTWGRPYPAVSAYLKEHADAREEVAEIVRQLESRTPPPRHRELAQAILDGMLQSLARLGIRFDEFVWESDLVRDGSVDRVLERLRAAPHAVREENGAWAIDASSYRLPKESAHVVFQRGDGTSLYVSRDVAYHLSKFERFRELVDVLGQDHQLHARTLDALLTEAGEARRPAFVIYQDITVPEGGRMSTRGGSAVWLDQLLAEAVERARKEVRTRRTDLKGEEADQIAEAVATGAVRYHIVRVAPEKPVVFRWEDALSFEGRSGPFAQYAYARASSVLRKAETKGGPFPYEAERLGLPDELELVRTLSKFPGTVAYAARTAHVHTIAGYAHDLADRFNRFYEAVPVLRSEAERASRIALVAATRQTLGNALDLLGVARLESM
jgi:arginyl-tRNA synthetase